MQSFSSRQVSSNWKVKATRGNLYPRLSLNAGINTTYSSAQEAQFYPDGGYRFATLPDGSDRPPFAFVNKDLNAGVYSIEATGTYRNTYLFKDQIKDNIYRTLGFQLSIPILNGYSARADLQRSIIQNQQAKIDAQQTAQTLRQNVETSYNEAVSASKTYNASLRQVQAREEAFRMMEQRYNAGAATSFEFQVSQNDLYQAKTDLTRAKYDFIFKTKVLDFYQGRPLEY
jgi:outer membrane protein